MLKGRLIYLEGFIQELKGIHPEVEVCPDAESHKFVQKRRSWETLQALETKIS